MGGFARIVNSQPIHILGQIAQDSSMSAAVFRVSQEWKRTARHAALALLFTRASVIHTWQGGRPAGPMAPGRDDASHLIRQACLASIARSELQVAIAKGNATAAAGIGLPGSQTPSAATVQQHEIQTRAIPESSLVQVDLVPDRGSRGPLGSSYRCGIHRSGLLILILREDTLWKTGTVGRRILSPASFILREWEDG